MRSVGLICFVLTCIAVMPAGVTRTAPGQQSDPSPSPARVYRRAPAGFRDLGPNPVYGDCLQPCLVPRSRR